MTATKELPQADVYGTPEQKQRVRFEYEYYPVRKFFGDRSNHFVNFCRVVDGLEFQPKDLKFDLELAIAEHLGVEVGEVKIECEIEVNIVTPVLV